MKTCSQCHQPKPSEEFNKRRASLDGLAPLCRLCQNARDIKKYRENPQKAIDTVRQRTVKNMAEIDQVKLKSGCVSCGIAGPALILDLDHLQDKKSNVSRIVSHSLNAIRTEMAKCQVLCSNCHRATTYKRMHGTMDPVVPKKCSRVPALMRNWKALLDFKHQPCMDCGKSFHFSVMDCDHRDPKTKVDDPSTMARGAEPAFLAELTKCDIVCSNCHRLRSRLRHQSEKDTVRDRAKSLMKSSPGMSYQKAIRETIAKIEGGKPDAPVSMSSFYVTKITNEQASSVILKYEWLGTMGHPQACYGLWVDINGIPELAGAVCFGFATGRQASNVCGAAYAAVSICLERGACVHWAPKNAGSFLVSEACRQASKDYGWKIFFAYSDPEANEIGTIYQACNWYYLGQGPGHGNTRVRWYRPDGKAVTSRTLRSRHLKTQEALALGWRRETIPSRGKYVWFQGTRREKKMLLAALVHRTKPYPKRYVAFP